MPEEYSTEKCDDFYSIPVYVGFKWDDMPPKNWSKYYVRYNEKIMHLPYTD